jgi:hypothetical protein
MKAASEILKYRFTLADVFLFTIAIALVVTHAYANSSDYLIGFLSIEYLLCFLITNAIFRSVLQSVFLIILGLRITANFFGFADINVAMHALIENAGYFEGHQKTLLFLGAASIIFIFSTTIILSRKDFSTKSSKNVWMLTVVAIASLSYAEKNVVVATNLVGNSFQYVTGLSVRREPLRVIEKSVEHFDIKNAISNHNEVYLFLIESLGWFGDDRIRGHFASILASSGKSISSYGVRELTSGTLGGELRELCGIRTNHLSVTSTLKDFESCAPHIARKHGFMTTAIHPGPRGIYNRKFIYPAIGFDAYISGESMKSIERCDGGWPLAPCDSSVIREHLLNRNSGKGEKNFYYYLSINSHHPYTNKSLDRRSCEIFEISDKKSCEYFLHIEQIFWAISELASEYDGYFYITGDHPPPGLTGGFTIKGTLPVYIIN